MRITQSMIYGNSLTDMNATLSRLAAVQEQNASTLRINRPSDDAPGYFEARGLDGIITGLDQYAGNVDTATSWLGQADSTLVSASSLLTSVKGLAQQASTETMTDTDLQTVASQVRGLFQELIGLSNASMSGNSLFAGQKTGSDAFTETLFATVKDDSLTQDAVVSVSGASGTSVMVQFLDSGQVGGATDIGYRYSTDGGSSWTQGTLSAGSTTLTLGGCSVTMAADSAVTATGDGEGTSLVVRPSAMYLGDSKDGAQVRAYGSPLVSASAQGAFTGNVSVRLDADASLPGPIDYSYSLDGGATWVAGNTASGASLAVPGGFLNLASNGGTALTAGTQYTIVPDTAEIRVNVSPSTSVTINNVGKDVFGGLYADASGNTAVAFGAGSSTNIFETVGELIGCLETGDTDGVGDCLEKLNTAQEHLETCAADVGARESRLSFADSTLSTLRDNAVTRLSDVEDADLSQLLLDMTKYQYAYQCVLASSTKLMNLSILDYL